MITLTFERGTLLIQASGGAGAIGASGAAAAAAAGGASPSNGFEDSIAALALPETRLDPRIGVHRAPARAYRAIVLELRRQGIEYRDEARKYDELPLRSRIAREPYPFQREAVEAFFERGGAGVVVLPTGAGKTFVAQMVLERAARSALVVAPTIDLMQQWFGALETAFEVEVGLVGGGYHEVKPLTVTTYDSAYLHCERFGDRFGVVVFDECHHLPGPSLSLAAECMLAPYRLGLTATPEREDGQEVRLRELIGPLLYRRDIKELAGVYLSEYETQRLTVRLSPDEQARYDHARAVYRGYLEERGLRLSSPAAFRNFLRLSTQEEDGRRALLAYREQKRIAEASEGKLRLLATLLARHRRERVLVFTADNATVHEISRRFLVPSITHETKVKERREILRRFNAGEWPFLATSKVLNEGVDVPAANVAVILSGSGSVREHVQRLGRILRRAEGKHAMLYEVVAEGTAEEFTSSRRRQHDAYR